MRGETVGENRAHAEKNINCVNVHTIIPGSQNCPADVFLPCWKGGRPAALDITVISTMQQSTIRSATKGTIVEGTKHL